MKKNSIIITGVIAILALVVTYTVLACKKMSSVYNFIKHTKYATLM